MRRLQLRPTPGPSPIHNLRAHTKIVSVGLIATSFIFRPEWPVIGLGWALFVAIFLLARLPKGVLAPPPVIFFYALLFGGIFTLSSGGEPVVGGIELGGLIEFLQLMLVGLLVLAFTALLAWTTPLSDVGVGLHRLFSPLERVGLPGRELATVATLAARSLPLVRDELYVVADARSVRHRPKGERLTVADALRDGVDFGATVMIAAHRRSRELAKAMVVRGSVEAPQTRDYSWRRIDRLAAGLALAWFVAIVVIF